MENKASNILKCILPSVMIFALQMFLSGAGAFVMFCKQAHDYTSGGLSGFFQQYYDAVMSTDFNVGVMLMYAIVAGGLFIAWYYYDGKPVVREKSGLAVLTDKPLAFFAGLVLLAVGMQYLCTFCMNLLSLWFPDWLVEYETLMEGMGLNDTVTLPLVLYAVILGPVCEEYAFRGLTMRYARRVMPFWTANVVQALLFAGMHMNPLQATYTFVLGLVLGYLVERSGSIAMGVWLHIAFNAAGVFSGGISVGANGPIFVFLLLFGSMAATYIGFVLINKNIPARVNDQAQSSDNHFTA